MQALEGESGLAPEGERREAKLTCSDMFHLSPRLHTRTYTEEERKMYKGIGVIILGGL